MWAVGDAAVHGLQGCSSVGTAGDAAVATWTPGDAAVRELRVIQQYGYCRVCSSTWAAGDAAITPWTAGGAAVHGQQWSHHFPP